MGDQVPHIPEDLLDYLSRLYPERSPERGETMEALYFRGGQRSVVRHLLRMKEEQDANITDKKVVT